MLRQVIRYLDAFHDHRRATFGRAVLEQTAVAQISRRLLQAARQAFGRAVLVTTQASQRKKSS